VYALFKEFGSFSRLLSQNTNLKIQLIPLHVTPDFDAFIRYKLSTMGCGSTFAQLPLSQFVKMLKDCGVLGELVSAFITSLSLLQRIHFTFLLQVSSADVTHVFLEARIIRPKELVTGDRCLSFVDFVEGLARLATKMHGFWPLPEKEKKLTEHDPEQNIKSNIGTLERLEQERVQLEADKEAERMGMWSDEAFSATHRTIMHLLESLLMALRDQDPAGLHFYFDSCKQREKRLAENVLERQTKEATKAAPAIKSIRRASSIFDSGDVRKSMTDSHINALFQSEKDALEDLVFNLEAIEELAEQAIHVHRAKTKGATTDYSLDSLITSDNALEKMLS
jgi:hypothetical protein